MTSNQKVHEINQQRYSFGEYHNLMPFLRKHPDKFFEYMRMPIDCFDYILYNVTGQLDKNWCNLHVRPIKTEERLVVTIRYTDNLFEYI